MIMSTRKVKHFAPLGVRWINPRESCGTEEMIGSRDYVARYAQ